MKVIICGAGQVGSNIARHLAAEANDVTVIDSSPELIQKISDTLDVKAMVGFASLPNVLEQAGAGDRSEEHTSELQSLMRISYAVFCLKKKKKTNYKHQTKQTIHTLV